MMRRVGVRLVGSLLLGSAFGGCYAHHTADEELLNIGFPDEAYVGDAGVAKDAGKGCTQTDPIQLLICQFTSGIGGGANPTGTGTGTGTGGLDIGSLINGFLGGASGTGAGTGTGTSANGLQDLINLFGGGGTTGGTTGGIPGTTGGTTANPLQDIISQFFGARDGGVAQMQQMQSTVTKEQCATTTDATKFLPCLLNGFPTPALQTGGRDGGVRNRDGGAGTLF